MIRFLFKGLIRDRSRSLFPILVVAIGAFLTVSMQAWIKGRESDLIWSNAAFQTGHVKIITRAYREQADQLPNDLALIGVDSLTRALNSRYPDLQWTPRIRFGGLLDIPDSTGETKSQAPVMGLAVDFGQDSPEYDVLNLQQALVQGDLPRQPNELLISEILATQLGVTVGQEATLIGSTMYGSMAVHNFKISGTIRFGINSMDRRAIVANIQGVRTALDMDDASSEILGYFDDYIYHDERAASISRGFNSSFRDSEDEFAPIMLELVDQNGLREMLALFRSMSKIMLGIFVGVMSLVLWNTGLMGSLRRYGEIGVRLAIGEEKGHVYRAMIGESILIGFMGGMAGTILGLIVATYLQHHGIDLSSMMKDSTMLMSDVYRAQVTSTSYLIGFLPGLLAPVIGTGIAGIGIYKRQTSQLFKELEV